MKKDDIDLRALENADEETIKRLSELVSPVSEKDRDRLFEKCEKRIGRESGSEDTGTVVTGVETYRRPVWRSALAVAASFVLIAGACTGGALMLKSLGGGSDIDPTAATDTTTALAIEEIVSAAPFGDISGGRVRFLTPAYVPYVYDTFDAGTAAMLADVFNSSTWEELPADTPRSDGESTFLYVNNGGQRFRLEFHPDNTAIYEKDGISARYSVSEEAYSLVRSLAHPTDPADALQGHLIWCKMEDLTPDGVWKNNEAVPEDIFEEAPVPEELAGTEVIENYPVYCYDFDIRNIDQIAENCDDLITGKVEKISYRVQRSGFISTPDTIITVTVTGDTAGRYSAGDTVDIATAGGYVSMRDMLEGQIEEYGRSNIAMTDEEIDSQCYHVIVESGEVPFIGKEYAFFVADDTSGGLSSTGFEYGMLYKCDNTYIQRVVDSDSGAKSFNFFDMNGLRELLGLPAETPSDDEEWGAEMTMTNVTPKGGTLTINVSGSAAGGRLQCGDDFVIEALTENGWEPLEAGENAVFNSVAYNLDLGKRKETDISWDWIYGELPAGTYRLGKKIMYYRAPGGFDESEVYAQFTVNGDGDTENVPYTTSPGEKPSAPDRLYCSEEKDDKWGISMELSRVTSGSARLTIKRSDAAPDAVLQQKGGKYRIERRTADGWEPMPDIVKYIFPDDMYDIPVNDQLVFDIVWSWKYGKLPAGSYRLVMAVSERGDSGTDSSQEYHVPFIIMDGNNFADLPYYDIPGTTGEKAVTLPVTTDKGQAKMLKVTGDNGKEGYVYESELLDDGVTNPTEAMAKMDAIKNGTYVPKTINVYDADGVTVIDTLTEQLN